MNNNNFIVSDVMLDLNNFPIVSTSDFLKDSIELMDKYRLGIICIVDHANVLQGIMTDGDLRRNLSSVQKPLASYFLDYVGKYCKQNFATINENDTLIKALEVMEEKEIWDLPVVNDKYELKGLLHLHKAIKKILNLKTF